MTQPLPQIDRPRSLLDFVRMFPTDEACAEYLFHVHYPNRFVCPRCSSQTGWPIALRSIIECNNGHQVSLKSGTVMHRSRQDLTTWFYAAYLMSTLTPGISALQFQKQLGIKRYKTAFNILHKLRSALVAPDREKLKSEVEVDECYIGGPEEGRTGRSKGEKSLVVVAVEIVRWVDTSGRKPGRHATQYDREGPPEHQERSQADGDPVPRWRAGRVRMTVVPDASSETLLPWIESNIANGTKIYTDGWKGYNNLESRGYYHIRTLQSHNGHKTGKVVRKNKNHQYHDLVTRDINSPFFNALHSFNHFFQLLHGLFGELNTFFICLIYKFYHWVNAVVSHSLCQTSNFFNAV